MKKENKKIILDELKMLGIALLLFYAFFQIHYHKENFFVVLKMVFAHFYLFIIPGYSLSLIFYEKINKIERLIIGVGIGYGLQPFLLYLINAIVKVNIMKYNVFVSAAMILLGLWLFNRSVLKEKISGFSLDIE
ncbi:hypothetical protein JXB27_04315 [Candidatus Woesearchaeota archaeon]|nr:hypothetical protein [Candidatus Woesearchaeota archaeon]